MTAVLLVLAGVHSGVVGNADNKSAVHARISHGEERVGSNVETNVLHCAE